MTDTDQTADAGQSPKAVSWFAAYVYGTIATLVAIGGLTFEKNLNPLQATGVIVVGAIAIWLAHAVSQLVGQRATVQDDLHVADVRSQLQSSWPIVSAAIPAALVMVIACFGVWSASTGLVIDEVFGVVALAAVGMATAGGTQRTFAHRVIYVVTLTAAGVVIVGLEVASHFL